MVPKLFLLRKFGFAILFNCAAISKRRLGTSKFTFLCKFESKLVPQDGLRDISSDHNHAENMQITAELLSEICLVPQWRA